MSINTSGAAWTCSQSQSYLAPSTQSTDARSELECINWEWKLVNASGGTVHWPPINSVNSEENPLNSNAGRSDTPQKVDRVFNQPRRQPSSAPDLTLSYVEASVSPVIPSAPTITAYRSSSWEVGNAACVPAERASSGDFNRLAQASPYSPASPLNAIGKAFVDLNLERDNSDDSDLYVCKARTSTVAFAPPNEDIPLRPPVENAGERAKNRKVSVRKRKVTIKNWNPPEINHFTGMTPNSQLVSPIKKPVPERSRAIITTNRSSPAPSLDNSSGVKNWTRRTKSDKQFDTTFVNAITDVHAQNQLPADTTYPPLFAPVWQAANSDLQTPDSPKQPQKRHPQKEKNLSQIQLMGQFNLSGSVQFHNFYHKKT